MDDRNLSAEHDTLVLNLAKHLKKRFYQDVRASAGGFPSPHAIKPGSGSNGYVPDVTMIARGSQLNFFEVETPESLRNSRSGHKWSAIAEHAKARNGKFWIVVPKGLREEASARIGELRLDASVWEI